MRVATPSDAKAAEDAHYLMRWTVNSFAHQHILMR